MDTATLLLVGGSVLVAIVVVGGTLFGVLRLFKGMSHDSAERARLLREGIQASGRVMGVQMGGMSMSVGAARHLQLHIQLEVQPPGRPPYAAMLTTMISELQIPQIQPGAMLTLRIDRMDPNKIALEAAGAPMPQAYDYRGQPMGMPQPMMGGYGMPLGAPPVVPQGAKIGLWLGVGGALIGVIVAIVVVAVNVGGVGLESANEGDGTCAKAVRCCEVVAAGNPSAANCKNMGKLGVPEQACASTLKSMQDSAKAQGKTCR